MDERLVSSDEYETSDMKMYKTEPRQKNAKTFFRVPADKFDWPGVLAMIDSC
jgi:hypothetical protein